MKTYKGWRLFAATLQDGGPLESVRHEASGVRVVIVENGRERALPKRLDLRRHSPDGFNWGYSGSGPAQLALAILADALGWRTAREVDPRLWQEFKRRHVARWGHAWELSVLHVLDFATRARSACEQEGRP